MCDRAHLLLACLGRATRDQPVSIDVSNLDRVDELYCAVTGTAPTDSAKELKARAKMVGRMLGLAEVAGCRPDAPMGEVVAKLREIAAHGWLRVS